MKMRSRNSSDKVPPLVSPGQYDERVATALVSARLAEPHRIDAVRDSADEGTLAEKLIDAGIITDDTLTQTLAAHYGVEELDFRHTDPQPEAVALISADTARGLRALPVQIQDGLVTESDAVARSLYPQDIETRPRIAAARRA